MPEALAAVRKAIKTGGHYPDGEAANKLIWLAYATSLKNGIVLPMIGRPS
ncbi:MAG: hypothetical protein KER_02885 [Kerstersia gyiorum]